MKSNNQFIKSVELVSKNILDSIPDKPNISLHNYLLDLINESDGKENSLYLNNVNPFIKEVWVEIIKNNKKVREFIPNKLNITPSVLYAYKNGRKAISIQMLYKLISLSNKNVNKIWDNIFQSEFTFSTHSKHQKTKLPKSITPRLSYIIGWLCGDGSFQQRHNYVVKISEKSTNQLLILKSLFKDLFGVETPIFNRYMGGYALQIGSKPIYRFLTQVMNIKVGQIPHIVEMMDKTNKKYFLIGIFDSEGCVYLNRFRLTISQADNIFLEKIKEFFKEFNINCRGPTFHKTELGEWYTIRIDGKQQILEFYNQFGSCHIDKLQKLYNLVKKID